MIRYLILGIRKALPSDSIFVFKWFLIVGEQILLRKGTTSLSSFLHLNYLSSSISTLERKDQERKPTLRPRATLNVAAARALVPPSLSVIFMRVQSLPRLRRQGSLYAASRLRSLNLASASTSLSTAAKKRHILQRRMVKMDHGMDKSRPKAKQTG